jgi:hypothetical protein
VAAQLTVSLFGVSELLAWHGPSTVVTCWKTPFKGLLVCRANVEQPCPEFYGQSNNYTFVQKGFPAEKSEWFKILSDKRTSNENFFFCTLIFLSFAKSVPI